MEIVVGAVAETGIVCLGGGGEGGRGRGGRGEGGGGIS
jgi:hypothetical protein